MARICWRCFEPGGASPPRTQPPRGASNGPRLTPGGFFASGRQTRMTRREPGGRERPKPARGAPIAPRLISTPQPTPRTPPRARIPRSVQTPHGPAPAPRTDAPHRWPDGPMARWPQGGPGRSCACACGPGADGEPPELSARNPGVCPRQASSPFPGSSSSIWSQFLPFVVAYHPPGVSPFT